jgi:hypothetical protein
MRLYRVPADFWYDYADRSPVDRPDQMAEFIRPCGRSVYIVATAEQIECLRADAAWYADGNVDECARLVRSARATLSAIARQSVREAAD